MTLLAGGEAGQLTGQDLARLGDVARQGLGFGEIEVEGVAGTLELTFGGHGRFGSKRRRAEGKEKWGYARGAWVGAGIGVGVESAKIGLFS